MIRAGLDIDYFYKDVKIENGLKIENDSQIGTRQQQFLTEVVLCHHVRFQ